MAVSYELPDTCESAVVVLLSHPDTRATVFHDIIFNGYALSSQCSIPISFVTKTEPDHG